MTWFYNLMEKLFAALFPMHMKRLIQLERFLEIQAQENLDVHQHLKDLEKRYQRLTVDSTPPNVVTTDSLVLLELNTRIMALEKAVRP